MHQDSATRAFLRANFDDYLVRDLRTMLYPALDHWDGGGGIGYPLVMTAFAGIELLGECASDRPYPVRGTQSEAFLRFWTDFLYPTLPKGYEVGEALYKAARHGIAHLFLLKGNVCVTYQQSAYHLRPDSAGNVYIDAYQLAVDLINAYEQRFLAVLDREASDPARAALEARVSEISAALSDQKLPDVFGAPAGPPLPRSGSGYVFSASASAFIATSASASSALPVFPPPLKDAR